MKVTRQDAVIGAEVVLLAAGAAIAVVCGGAQTGLLAALAGLGVNWTSDVLRQAFGHGCDRVVKGGGALNHDLQNALIRAFQAAVAHLRDTWWDTDAGRRLRQDARRLSGNPDARRRLDEAQGAFEILAECPQALLGAATVSDVGGDHPLELLAAGAQEAQRALSERLDRLLFGHDPALIRFVRDRLAGELAFFFAEELKEDNPRSNRAWRAYQRLLLDGLQEETAQIRAGVSEVRATQEQLTPMLGRLTAWADQLERMPEELRERTGEEALDHALTRLSADLVTTIERESGETRATVTAGLSRVQRLFSRELERLRRDLLPALRSRGLYEDGVPLSIERRAYCDSLLGIDRGAFHPTFVGRARELAAVRDFLESPSGGYLLVTAPAGSGKSALMAEIARREDCVYHFISRQDGTADEEFTLGCLCEQLAARHGLGGALPDLATDRRILLYQLLGLPPRDGRPVIVVLDGLDEALGWNPDHSYLPPTLPDGVKVTLAARPLAGVDWRQTLRIPGNQLDRIDLQPMEHQDVAAMLAIEGGAVASFAEDPAFVGRLRAVSGGDAFYLTLLIEDLRHRPTPEVLERAPNTLDGYLQRWWDDLGESRWKDEVGATLAILALAQGRLTRDALVTTLSPIQPLIGMRFDSVLQEAGRLVAGDRQAGYALCHAAFAAYVRRELIGGTRLWREALLDYCRGWAEPDRPYARERCVTHLAEAGRWDELHALVATGNGRQPFAEARHGAEGSYTGYLADLDLGWTQIEQEAAVAPAAFGRQVRYALIQSSIRSLATGLPRALVAALVRCGRWDGARALGWAMQKADPNERFDTLVALVPPLCARGEGAAALAALRQAWSVPLVGWELRPERVQHVAAVIPALPPELQAQARAEARAELDDPSGRDWAAPFLRNRALLALIRDMPPDERTGQAAELLEQVLEADPAEHGRELLALIPLLPPDLLPRVLAAVRQIEDPEPRALLLCTAAESLDGAPREAALNDALDGARRLIALAAADRQPIADVPEMLTSVEGAVVGQNLTATIIGGRSGRLLLSMIEFDLDPSLHRRWWPRHLARLVGALRIGARVLRARRRPEGDLIAALNIPPPLLQSALLDAIGFLGRSGPIGREPLAALAPYLPVRLLEAALDILIYFEQPAILEGRGFRVEAQPGAGALMLVRGLDPLAPHLSPRQIESALAAVRRIPDASMRVAGLRALAPHLPPNRARALLQDAERIDAPMDRAALLAALVPAVHQEEHPAVVHAALAAAEGAAVAGVDAGVLVDALVEIAPHADDERRGRIEELLMATLTGVRRRSTRAELAERVVPLLAPERLVRLAGALRTIDDAGDRSLALAALAPHLPAARRAEAVRRTLASLGRDVPEAARAAVIRRLAPYLDADLAERALASARGLQARAPRTWALASLVSVVAAGSRDALVDEIRDAARLLLAGEAEEEAGDVIGFAFLPLLCHQEGEAYEGLKSCAREIVAADALTALLPHVSAGSQAAVAEEAFAPIRRLSDERRAGYALGALALILPDDLRARAVDLLRLRIADADRDDSVALLLAAAPVEQWGAALTAIAGTGSMQALPYMLATYLARVSPEQRAEVVAAALGRVRRAREETFGAIEAAGAAGYAGDMYRHDPYVFVGIEAALLPHLPEHEAAERLPATVGEALRILESQLDWMEMLRALAAGIGGLPVHLVAPQWPRILRACAADTRSILQSGLTVLTPVLVALGGEEAAAEAFDAIQDVAHWWP